MNLSSINLTAAASDCLLPSGPLYHIRHLFFQNGTATYRVDYVKEYIKGDSVIGKAASCDLTHLNETVSGVFEKVAGCLCKTQGTKDVPASSALDLLGINGVEPFTSCMIRELKNVCDSGRPDIPWRQIGIIVGWVALGCCVLGGIGIAADKFCSGQAQPEAEEEGVDLGRNLLPEEGQQVDEGTLTADSEKDLEKEGIEEAAPSRRASTASEQDSDWEVLEK